MTLKRTIAVDAAQQRAAMEGNTIEMAISSEQPYERWFGIEILGHAPGEVDLSRLADGRHPLLLNHDTECQIGVIDSARVDGDAVLRGVARFSSSEEAQQIRVDVADGIRTLVSVGYMVDQLIEMTAGEDGKSIERTLSWAEFEAEQKALHGESFYRSGVNPKRAAGDKTPVYRVTRWTPFEASLVAVPADTSVGVGRTGVEPKVEQQPAVPAVTAAPPPVVHVIQETRMTTETKSPAELDFERRSAIITMGVQYAKYVDQPTVQRACQESWSLQKFQEHIMERMQSQHTDTSALQLGMTPKEVQRYSLGRALVAAVTGNWEKAGLERECSAALAKLTGRAPEGFYLPFDTFRRDFNVGTTTEAGNLVATDLRGDLYVDALRNAIVLGGMGVRIIAGLTSNVDMPRKSSPTSLSRLTEIGSASETSPLTAKVTLSPKRVGGYVEVSKQALIQSSMALESMIRDDLLMSAAVELEDQCINGSGTSPNIQGIRNYTTIGSTTAGANGAAPTWANFVDLESACANSNAEPDNLAGYVTNTKTRGKLKQTQMGTNLPFIWQNGAQPVNGYKVGITNNVPSNLTKGTSTTVCSAALFSSDWSMAVVGLFGAPDVIVDPYSKADTGQVKITLNQFSDMGIRQPAAFAKVVDLLSG